MKVLVTGGGGFLGNAIIKALQERGDRVSCIQRGHYPQLETAGTTIYTGDLCNRELLLRASKGCDLVMHVAGKTGVWGPYAEYHHTNVTGTMRIIEACRQNNISRLVFTSTPSVVFSGKDEVNINESTAYPKRFLNHYQSTKAMAEQLILQASDTRLATVALRPHLIWGPGDPHLIRRVVERAKHGKLRLVGRDNLVDSTYIDNAVQAHLLAAEALQPGAACSGKAYFISNGEPLPMHDLINRILAAHDLPPVSRYMTPLTARLGGLGSELVYRLFGIAGEPLLTRFVARQLSCAHWYDISAARRDFGYIPAVSINEGLRRLQSGRN
jgi:nucleoside-diphosphate-sugar epimerase